VHFSPPWASSRGAPDRPASGSRRDTRSRTHHASARRDRFRRAARGERPRSRPRAPPKAVGLVEGVRPGDADADGKHQDRADHLGSARAEYNPGVLPRFGLNRFDARSVDAFAADVRRAEALGWDAAFQPDSQLRRRDTYVLMAAAARVTERILLATLLSNPVNRHPTVTASSIATVDELAPGRTLLGWGVGDTAVRLAGLKPARVAELESSTRMMRALLDGEGGGGGGAGAAPARPPPPR